MKIHRFYTPEVKFSHSFWLDDKEILSQWNKVLRFKPGQQVILFDGQSSESLCEIIELSGSKAKLKLVDKLKRNLPKQKLSIFWSLIKKDKNDIVLQKCTELGVTNFVPVISQRSIKKDFNRSRARKIIIEASEQCGRSDVPYVQEPVDLPSTINEYKNKTKLYYCDQRGSKSISQSKHETPETGIFIGPEGGWSQEEIKLFKDNDIESLHINDFTLRSETAAIVAASKIL